jgi:predicted HTH transcriptional regulator
MKNLCAFANTKGGRIVIGVTDDKKEVGIAFDNFKDHESYEKNFHQKVRNMFEDRLFGSYETHFIPSQLDPEMTLFMIEVKRSPNVVYFIDAKYSKKHQMHKEKEYYYTRVGESAIEALKEERIKLINSFK